MLWAAWAVQRAVGGEQRGGGLSVSVLAHWWHCHGNKTTAFAIVSRSAKFIINSARAAARCQTERERKANLSPGRGAEETDRERGE